MKRPKSARVVIAILAIALGIGIALYEKPKSTPTTETFDMRDFFQDLVSGTGCGTLTLPGDLSVKDGVDRTKAALRDCFLRQSQDKRRWGYLEAAQDAGCWNLQRMHVAYLPSDFVEQMRACLKRRAGHEPEWYRNLQREGLVPMTQGVKP